MSASAEVPSLPFLPLRARIAGALLSTFGLRATPRRARWLATVTAADAAPRSDSREVVEAGRRRLASVTQAGLIRHRASRESQGRLSRLRAAVPTLWQRAQDATDAANRLEALVPPGAVEEAPSWLLRGLLGLGLLAESLVAYGSLGATPLADSPLILAASCLALPTLAAAILSKAGTVLRRSVWRGKLAIGDSVLVLSALVVAAALGVGLTLSRVGDMRDGRTAALWTSAGLQLVILLLPLIDAYAHASPVPGLRAARRIRDRAVRQHDAQVAELRRLEAEHAQREVELLAHAEAVEAEFERTVARFIDAPAQGVQRRTGILTTRSAS